MGDSGDDLDIGSLSIGSGVGDKRAGNSPGDEPPAVNGKVNGRGAEGVDETADEVMFLGTNIQVKKDKSEDVIQRAPTVSIFSIAGDEEPDADDAECEDASSCDMLDTFDRKDFDYHEEPMRDGGGMEHERDDIDVKLSQKVTVHGPKKQVRGFLMNFFRGTGARATLKSIVQGKPVYNKIIDLDADPGATYDDHAANHAGTYGAHLVRSGSPYGVGSNESSLCNRRRRGHRNDYSHHDQVVNKPHPSQNIIGLGRMDPAQLGRLDMYGLAGGNGVRGKQSMTPDLFNGWVRAVFNVIVTTVLLYLGMVFIFAISRDIGNGVEKRRQMVKSEAMLCQELYRKNKCRTMLIPAMEEQCRQWEACMYKDAILYDDASFLSAEVLGGVINKFVSQLDGRTVGIVIAAFLALFVGSNCALSISSTSRPQSAGWFRGLFGRGGPPPNGSDLLQNPEYMPNLEMIQAMRNPYLQPNYCVMGNYPYVNTGGYGNPSYGGHGYYHDRPNEENEAYMKAARLSAWKRRFTSPPADH